MSFIGLSVLGLARIIREPPVAKTNLQRKGTKSAKTVMSDFALFVSSRCQIRRLPILVGLSVAGRPHQALLSSELSCLAEFAWRFG